MQVYTSDNKVRWVVHTYFGRLIIVKRMNAEKRYMRDWWCGYAEIKPGDGINAEAYSLYDDELEAPGGLTFGGELPGFSDPGTKFLGFETMHLGMADWDCQRVIGATCELADQIISRREERLHG